MYSKGDTKIFVVVVKLSDIGCKSALNSLSFIPMVSMFFNVNRLVI